MGSEQEHHQAATATDLVQRIRDSRTTGEPAQAELRTSDRVLARITDGIYREPSSALRELISNAYDADATRVTVATDAPRFNEIRIRDDGNGMGREALANLIHSIGGSVKRTNSGARYQVTATGDPLRSPGGRRLIGKIGIGLFSVAQLTRHFKILTKLKGESYTLIADVVLHTYSDEDLERKLDSDDELATGSVRIWEEHHPKAEAHGTEILLMDLRRQSKEILQSRALWGDVATEAPENSKTPLGNALQAPVYHIGSVDFPHQHEDVIRNEGNLPWTDEDGAVARMQRLHSAVIEEGTKRGRFSIDQVLDNYLRMIWHLSLAIPLPYVSKHPFEMSASDGTRFFRLDHSKKMVVSEVTLGDKALLCNHTKGVVRGGESPPDFSVTIDGVELRRPIEFPTRVRSSSSFQTPLLFFGEYTADLSSLSSTVTGGPLSFRGYLYWQPKVIPNQHQGVLVRIFGASGTLFDSTFMEFKVAEITRLRQITVEIFVDEGMESSLNIDRESFNQSHPHFQIVSRWLHQALRVLATKHKQLSRDARLEQREELDRASGQRLQGLVNEVWKQRTGNADIEAPEIAVLPTTEGAEQHREATGGLAFELERLEFESVNSQESHRAVAVAGVLAAYGVLDGLTADEQGDLIRDIMKVFRDA